MTVTEPHVFRAGADRYTCKICGEPRWYEHHIKPAQHRDPPPYPYQGKRRGNGWCVFCGGKILQATKGEPEGHHERRFPQRCTWHYECAHVVLIATQGQYARREVAERDQCICASCGKDSPRWHVDHIVPLYRAPREWRYWGLENLQTLCEVCHGNKSASEAAERARAKRGSPNQVELPF